MSMDAHHQHESDMTITKMRVVICHTNQVCVGASTEFVAVAAYVDWVFIDGVRPMRLVASCNPETQSDNDDGVIGQLHKRGSAKHGFLPSWQSIW